MRTRICLPILLCLWITIATGLPCRAELNIFPSGARAAGLGYAGVALNDVFATYNNQAGLAHLSHPVGAASYENRYFAQQLHLGSLVVAAPVPLGAVAALSAASFGYSAYSESRLGIALARRLHPRLSMGMQLCYNHVHIAQHGAAGALTVEVGILVQALEALEVGAHIYNPSHSGFVASGYSERLPVVFNLGAAYHIGQVAILAMQTELRSGESALLKCGIEYTPLPPLALRIGLQTHPTSLTAGMGYMWQHCQIHITFARHQVLGYSPQVSFVYHLAPSYTSR